ncbi:MAG: hypothetical protein C5B46_06165 [Proteobacteria bacterium]|nr:MAG: hypothetical protein C5B46_06165 [Pseudomonadota bacterium]
MNTGLQARIYDPLWLLARQWQVGEFQGEDNGSPARVIFQAESAQLTRFHAGALPPNTIVKGAPYANDIPLETLVECESVRPVTGASERLRFAADAGLYFLRLLDQQATSQNYRPAFIRKYALPPATDETALDDDSLHFLSLMAGRVPDGRQLYAALVPAANGTVVFPPDLKIATGDTAEVRLAVQLFRHWYETFFKEPVGGSSCWLPERMEYGFTVAARLSDGEKSLTAPEYYQGHLDWFDFDYNQEVNLGTTNDDAIKQIKHTLVPAPVSYRGMPAQRFWEFEDARVDFGAVNAGPEELARMLLVEFAISYGNDWFVIPVELDVGSVCRALPLIVTNTFGERFLIRSSHEAGEPFASWRMFQLSSPPQTGTATTVVDPSLFLLAPALLKTLEAESVEEVLFLRDEMANLAWAVEKTIESAIERPLNRYEQQKFLPAPSAVPSAVLNYQLATAVPDYWVPLLPVRTADGLRLQRGKVLKIDGQLEAVGAKGRVLTPDQPLRIFEEEIPREGVRVTRSWQLARWHDGSTHLWIGRQKEIGRGEGSSGLRFDSVEQ